MALAGLFLSAAMYMLVPVMSAWLMGRCGMSSAMAAVVMALPGIGVFLLGGFTSYLVQRYRRNIVCLRAVLLLVLTFIALYYTDREDVLAALFPLVLLLRLSQGLVYGEARMVLGSTLVIDTCESFQRTAANHAAGWFARFGLALGPAAALVAAFLGGFAMVVAVAASLCVVAYLLIAMVRFPFKAPDDVLCKFSLDRFWLTEGWGVALNLLPVVVAVGIVLASGVGLRFYAMMTCGFFIALLMQRFLFSQAEKKTEIIGGLMLLCAAFLILLTGRTGAPEDMSAMLFGCGTGLVGARFLLYMIKLSDHCQRGTAQSTFFLTCELGVNIGVAVAVAMLGVGRNGMYLVALVLVAVALAVYITLTDKWYSKHKHRVD